MSTYKIETPTELLLKHTQEVLFELGYTWLSGDTTVMYRGDARPNYGLIVDRAGKRFSFSDTGERHWDTSIADLHLLLEEKEGADFKVESGNWYFVRREDGMYNTDALVYYKKGSGQNYGWNYKGEWTLIFGDGWIGSGKRFITKATDEDVIKRVGTHMNDIGLFSGGRFVNTAGNREILGNISETRFWESDSPKIYCGADNGLVFNDGKWATVIKEPELPEIGGYDGQWNRADRTVSYGCKTFEAAFILSDTYNAMDSITIEGIEVTRREMDLVREFVKTPE